MRNRALLASLLLVAPRIAFAQQANVNLDWDPQRITEGLTPFSAPLNDRTVPGPIPSADALAVLDENFQPRGPGSPGAARLRFCTTAGPLDTRWRFTTKQ